MYAVVTVVNIDPAHSDEAQKHLEEQVVPMIKQTPGFVQGHWARDDAAGKGYGMVFYESEQDARNQLASLQQMAPGGPGPGVTWEVRTVGEVVVEAKR